VFGEIGVEADAGGDLSEFVGGRAKRTLMTMSTADTFTAF